MSAAKKEGGALAEAVLPDGKINLAHPATVRWAESHGVGLTELVGARNAKRVAEHVANQRVSRALADASALSIDDLMGMTLGEITDRLGNVEGLEDWLSPRKTAEEIKRLEIQNARARGELVERALVVAAFDDISRVVQDFVTNSPQTIVIENRAMEQNGTSVEEAIATTRKLIGNELRPGLEGAAQKIRDADG